MTRNTQGLRRAASNICFALGAGLVIAIAGAGRAAAQNTMFGTGALQNNTRGSDDSAFGFSALGDNTTGNGNTATGINALVSNIGGSGNTATGSTALYDNQGDGNTATGVGTLFFDAHGNYNTATGWEALFSNAGGSYNTASGWDALYSNTSGYDNIADGARAMYENDEGSKNTTVGIDAMVHNTTGSYNIALGYMAGSNLTTGQNDLDIGNVGVAAESNTIRIGTEGTQTATYIAGVSDAAVSGAEVVVSSSGQLGVVASSARFKRNIESMGASSGALMKLRPVTFRYKNDSKGTKQYGLIAEQVRQVYPELITYDAQGKIESVRYQELIPMLLNELQRQQSELQQQRSDLLELRAENGTLRTALQQVQGHVEHIAAQMPNLAQR